MSQTIRQAIISDNDVAGLLKQLKDLPERVRDASDVLADAEFEAAGLPSQLKEADQKIADVEREAMFEVRNDLNDKGKCKHSNDDQRKDAQIKLLRGEYAEDYVAAKNDLLKLKQHKATVENHIAKCRNQMWYIKNLYDTTIAAAHLVAGLCREEMSAGQLEKIERIKRITEEK